MDAGTFEILNTFGVDPGQIEEHLHLEEKWFISHPIKGLDHLFMEILQLTSFDGSRFELHRLRLKVIELLQYISQMDAVMDEELAPIRERRAMYEKDIPALWDMLKKGSEKARLTAAQTLSEVKRAMHINYFED